MKDVHRKAHFDLKTEEAQPILGLDELRIHSTLKMIPSDWQTIIDLGCGDGRISKYLIASGKKVLGIDWSQNSLKHFPGETLVCDIREPLPITAPYDGAICCEVLEHLTPSEASRVVENLKRFTKSGFIITVPANEPLTCNQAPCEQCRRSFHIWGHCQSFESFEKVDRMVGFSSSKRCLITDGRSIPSARITAMHRALGVYPYHSSYVCPTCGQRLREPVEGPVTKVIARRLISAIAHATAPLRPKAGWYACHYAK